MKTPQEIKKEEEKVKVELTKVEHRMITSILMMHHIGMVLPIHQDHRELLNKLAQDFSIRDMRLTTTIKRVK